MSETIITDQPGSATFMQVWTVGSAAHQDGLLDVMHRSIAILTRQPGFISMTLHVSLNGEKIAVYAQWESADLTTAAVSLPEAKQAHEEMTRWGTPDGTFYRVDSVFLPDAGASR